MRCYLFLKKMRLATPRITPVSFIFCTVQRKKKKSNFLVSQAAFLILVLAILFTPIGWATLVAGSQQFCNEATTSMIWLLRIQTRDYSVSGKFKTKNLSKKKKLDR
jgi:hypothetical protein